MSRALAFLLAGIGALGVALVVVGFIWGPAAGLLLAPPPEAVSLGLVAAAGAALLAAGWQWLRRHRAERAVQRRAAGLPLSRGLTDRLLGDYSPYAAEAAGELARMGDPEAGALLAHALDRLEARRPPGWQELAATMTDALADVGHTPALPLLRRLEQGGMERHIPGLADAIASLEAQAGLLRPAAASDDALLRPAVQAADADPAALLRPVDDAGGA